MSEPPSRAALLVEGLRSLKVWFPDRGPGSGTTVEQDPVGHREVVWIHLHRPTKAFWQVHSDLTRPALPVDGLAASKAPRRVCPMGGRGKARGRRVPPAAYSHVLRRVRCLAPGSSFRSSGFAVSGCTLRGARTLPGPGACKVSHRVAANLLTLGLVVSIWQHTWVASRWSRFESAQVHQTADRLFRVGCPYTGYWVRAGLQNLLCGVRSLDGMPWSGKA